MNKNTNHKSLSASKLFLLLWQMAIIWEFKIPHNCHCITFTSSLNTEDWIIFLLFKPDAISSKSMTERTFSLSFFTSRIFTSASSNALHISLNIDCKTCNKGCMSDSNHICVISNAIAYVSIPWNICGCSQ